MTQLLGQNPLYYKLEEKQLEEEVIFDVFQSSDGLYWIATNDGPYVYDGYVLTKLPTNEMSNKGCFALKENYSGEVFCHNIGDQIFKLSETDCELIFQVPDNIKGPDLSFDFDINNKLVVASKSLIRLDNGKIEIIMENWDHGYSKLLRKSNGTLSTVRRFSNELIEIDAKKVTVTILDSLNQKSPSSLLQVDGELFFFDEDNTKFWPRMSHQEEISKGSRLYNLSDGLYVAYPNGGVKKYGEMDTIFKNQFISCVFKDKDGNLLLGTFASGLMVVPNNPIKNYPTPESETMLNILKTEEDRFLISSSSGNVYAYQSNVEFSLLEGFKSSTCLEPLFGDWVLGYHNSQSSIYNWRTKAETKMYFCPKSVEKLTDSTFLYSGYSGTLKITLTSRNKKLEVSYESLSAGRKHHTSSVFHPGMNKYYATTTNGLWSFNSKYEKEIKYHGELISANDLSVINNEVWVASGEHGLMTINNDSVRVKLTVKDGLASNNIRKFFIIEDKIILLTDRGLSFLDKQGKFLYSITKEDGLDAQKIVDIESIGESYFLLGYHSIQTIPKDFQGIQDAPPRIQIKEFKVNGNVTSLNSFSYFDKNYEFEVSSPSLSKSAHISYEYQLFGFDTTWISKPYKENSVVYQHLPAGNFTFKVRAKFKDKYSNLEEFSFEVIAPVWQRLWFVVLCFLVVVCIVVLVARKQIKKQKRISRIEQDAIKSKLAAVQSQMNPHFIFNALNSIQDLVLDQEGENAYRYLNKFAFLVRKVLQYSQLDSIKLEDEIEVLKVYLELEHLRFEQDFEFDIQVENIEGVYVPPMLIQPFAENAVKHGLLHKKGLRKLSIQFYFIQDSLYCEVIDNGIGRKRAEQIKERRNVEHESFAIKSIQDRLEILKNIYHDNFQVEYTDLGNAEEAKGTKATIKLPHKLKY